jgi:hypothetical protein
MTTKRTQLERPRKTTTTTETVRLFVELDAVPMRDRGSRDFEQRAYELAQRLDLGDEHFCSRCSVLDRESGPCWPEGHVARDAWFRVRAVRNQLLAAAGLNAPPRVRGH